MLSLSQTVIGGSGVWEHLSDYYREVFYSLGYV